MAVRAQTAPALISLPERKASAGLWSNAWYRLRRDRLTMIAATIGVVLGLAAGYFRGRVDDVITWFITTLNSIPTIFLLIIISALFAPGPLTLTIIIGTIFWTNITNFVRGQTFALREREFVTAAR